MRAYFENIDTEKFERGWDYVSRIASSTLSTAQSQEVGNRIRAVQEKIQVLEQNINLSAANARQSAQEKGFVFEKWHAYTFNIDAAAKGSSDYAWPVGSNEYGSVDIETSYGEKASLKAYKTGKDSAFEQSKRAKVQSEKLWEGFHKKNQELAAGGNAPISIGEYVDRYVPDSEMKDIFVAKYYGQTRIIASDQMEEAVKYLEGKIDKLSQGSSKYDSAQQKVYEETLANLKDKLESPEGIASKPLSADELQAITEMAEEGKFYAEKRGIKVSSYITKSDILKNIITPAAEAAALQAA